MNKNFINKIALGDCLEYIPMLTDNSMGLFLSDIPYGISLDDWYEALYYRRNHYG